MFTFLILYLGFGAVFVGAALFATRANNRKFDHNLAQRSET